MPCGRTLIHVGLTERPLMSVAWVSLQEQKRHGCSQLRSVCVCVCVCGCSATAAHPPPGQASPGEIHGLAAGEAAAAAWVPLPVKRAQRLPRHLPLGDLLNCCNRWPSPRASPPPQYTQGEKRRSVLHGSVDPWPLCWAYHQEGQVLWPNAKYLGWLIIKPQQSVIHGVRGRERGSTLPSAPRPETATPAVLQLAWWALILADGDCHVCMKPRGTAIPYLDRYSRTGIFI